MAQLNARNNSVFKSCMSIKVLFLNIVFEPYCMLWDVRLCVCAWMEINVLHESNNILYPLT